jgi:integrase
VACLGLGASSSFVILVAAFPLSCSPVEGSCQRSLYGFARCASCQGRGQNDAMLRDVIAVESLVSASELAASARAFAQAATSEATRRAYRHQWSAFERWCGARGLLALPAAPATVALYLSELAEAGRKVATVEQALAAIAAAHGVAGHPSPRGDSRLRTVMRGIRRMKGVAQRQATPLLAGQLRAMLDALPDSRRGVRDRALLLMGFVGAFRRGELVALAVEDVVFADDGLEVLVRRSKVDQEGRGRKVALPYSGVSLVCPVRALRAWLDVAGIEAGPLFREVTRHGKVSAVALSGRSVSRVVKRAAHAAELEPAAYSGHSLRAGFATVAAARGKPERAIMRQTGHRSVAMVHRYIRDAELWSNNAAVGLLE